MLTSFRLTRRRVYWATSALITSLLVGCGSGSDGTASDSSAVTIKRDKYGVPHVYADSTRGVFYGFGYAVAEDRLFQMEMSKRSVLGTVSEVMGPAYINTDIASRKVLNVESIRAQMAKLPQADLDIFEGYAAGYNARVRQVLADKAHLLPKQFNDAGFEPSTWTALDVAMIWVGTMANRYSNSSSEVSNLQLLTNLKNAKGDDIGQKLFDQLRWIEDPTAPTTVPRAGGYTPIEVAAYQPARPRRVLTASTETNRKADHRLGSHFAKLAPAPADFHTDGNSLHLAWAGLASPEQRPVASNLWIVGPQKTTDGSTILNNGPQFGWFNPSYVFSVGLHGGGFDVVGNTPFAHPVILFGTNGTISWGSTAGPLDVNDMYQEKLDPNDPTRYMFNGSYQSMSKRTEIIAVKGQASQTADIYSTVHGLVTTSDPANGVAYSMKRSWDGYEIDSLVGWIRLTQAKDWNEFLAQASRIAITINMYYADKSGNIGYVSPGRLPIRPPTQDIRLPAVGDGSMEWQGIRPFSENPQVYNPPQGYIVNWNNQSAPGMVSDGGNYSVVHRVNEFIFRIQAKPKLTPDEVADLNRQTSFADLNARYFVPYIMQATQGLPANDPAAQAAQMLSQWSWLNTNPNDGATYQETAATIMRTWLPIMYNKLLADDLPPNVLSQFVSPGYPTSPPSGSVNPGNGAKILYNALRGSAAGVPQTYDFFNGADKYTMIRDALWETMDQLTNKYGADTSAWVTPVVKHQFFSVNFMGYPQAGSDENLYLPTFMNRGTENNTVTFAPGKTTLCTVAPPGQSGFVGPDGSRSKHYDDQLDLYKNFKCKDEWLNAKDVDANLESTITLDGK